MSTPLAIIAAQVGSDESARAILQKLKVCGWVCVPEKPTRAMLEAAYWSAYAENAAGVWESMIEASISECGELSPGQGSLR